MNIRSLAFGLSLGLTLGLKLMKTYTEYQRVRYYRSLNQRASIRTRTGHQARTKEHMHDHLHHIPTRNRFRFDYDREDD